GSEAFRTAESFAAELVKDREGILRRLEDRPGGMLGARLGALYDERAAPPPVDAASVRFHHAQGPRAEVRLASRLALHAAGVEGVAPHEIAIVARTLTPYSAAIEDVLGSEEIPWS